MKIAFGVEYRGTEFSGWQFQGHEQNTVQYYLQEAFSFVADEPVHVHGSGRTDAGVHALEQVCHFETNVLRSPYSWRQGANTRLPPSIRVRWAQPVDDCFHARSKALFRDYIYLIHQTEVPSAHWPSLVTSHRKQLDVDLMNEAAKWLIGEHDFSSFRAANCQAMNPRRCIFEATLWQMGAFIAFGIRGNAFLYHMVRNIVGSLLWVGEQQKPPEWIQQLLLLKDRSQAAPTAPAHGLYLRGTHYAHFFKLPKAPSSPFGLFDQHLATWHQGCDYAYHFGDRLTHPDG